MKVSLKKYILPTMLTAFFAGNLLSCTKREMVSVDGSSTVYPITEAVAEEFRNTAPEINVTVGISGTGGGFKKFCNSEIDISDASRTIKEKEIEKCKSNGISYVEIPVAYDGLAVVVHKSNSFLNHLTVDQLKQIFRAENPAKTWKEIDAAFPEEPIKIFSPGQDSGTFDYFVETVIGERGKVRNDAIFSEDDNVLVTGVSGDKNSIGFFGFAYYQENRENLKVVQIINPKTKKAVTPSIETVANGTYAPLSRPIFIYVSKDSLKKGSVFKFVDFYLNEAAKMSGEVGYIPLPVESYERSKKEIQKLR